MASSLDLSSTQSEGHPTCTKSTTDGKLYTFSCNFCDRSFSTKQNTLRHIQRVHGNPASTSHDDKPKEMCYSVVEKSGKTYFQCLLCHKCLSAKRRILDHLYSQHNKSPLKKVYKCYDSTCGDKIPKRTLMRQRTQSKTKNDSPDCSSTGTLDICDSTMDTFSIHSGLSDHSNDMSHTSNDSLELSSFDYSSLSDCEDLGLESSKSDLSDCSSVSSDDGDVEEQLEAGKLKSLCITTYLLRHNLSQDAKNDLTKLLSIVSEQDIPALDLGQDSSNYESFHYCSVCKEVFPDDEDVYLCNTINCGNFRYKGGEAVQLSLKRKPQLTFLMANVITQLKYLLERKNVWNDVCQMKEKALCNQDNICDIIDGHAYQMLCQDGQFLHHKTHISAIFNTDGVPLYSSSNVKLWPIFLAINELPASYRFARENLILAGIWQGKNNPPFKQLMGTFAHKMNVLYDEGFDVNIPGFETPIKVKLGVFLGSVDLQAKAYILNMSMHNGKNGCSTCTQEGIVVPKGRGHCRIYPYKTSEDRDPVRDSQDIKENLGPSASERKRLQGIIGPSGLSIMPYFDLVHGIVPDYMHGVLMGTVKKLMYMWFSSTNSSHPSFLGKHLKDISKILTDIQPPDYIERLPRDLEKHYSNFKATELQSWLLYYCLPCTSKFMKSQYLSHFCLLSSAIHMLLGDNITPEELETSAQYLEQFYSDVGELYGESLCGLNIHNIGVHLVHYVQQWGPLWAWSCFGFEDANAAILQAVHGTGEITKQYTHQKILQLKMRSLNTEHISCNTSKAFIEQMKLRKRSWKSMKEMANCLVAGKLLQMEPNEENEVFTNSSLKPDDKLQKVLRVDIQGHKIYSEQYGRMAKRICHVVLCQDRSLLSIKYFVVDCSTSKVFGVGTKLKDTGVDTGLRHVMKVEHLNETVVVLVHQILEKLFFIHTENEEYVARSPNLLGHCVFK